MPLNTTFSFNQDVDAESNEIAVCDLLSLIKRPGIESLVDYLRTSDYFTAPASTKYHNSFAGGLCLHSLKVMRMFSDENELWEKPLPQDSVILCGLLHDLYKINAYMQTDEGYVSINGNKGHATVSLSRIREHIQLTPEEDDIIRFHMGIFGIFTYHEHDTLKIHKAISRTPQVQVFASIDQADSKRKSLREEF